MNTYTTVAEALDGLKKEGYTLDLKLTADCIECKAPRLKWYPDEFIIDNFYRFEGDSNPDDNAIVFAVSTKSGLKGTIVDAYGVYADSLTYEMIEKLKIRR